ncbi:hypothetical protein HNQ88_001723 [Aureibacter tunicatorum]|uniref:Uncharacterized protein n=1 Tax=Aureibacter tunicatorum TaxID=866807 RepID=A0AAE3XJ41_9BACT|nr:hypothetical protein [Aureibacter tunicatorum]BDD05383.1 hypothetical protein AUTU_28660 [Aureibacter tunicatorum]
MLKYSKLILSKVSFNYRLFEKELLKAIINLMPNEVDDLKRWCYEQFGHNQNHQKILLRNFL